MEIVPGTIRYYPSLRYRRINKRLLFGWFFFFHKDGGSCDIQLYGPWHRVGLSEFPQRSKQLDIVRWRCYNTLYGRTWSATIFGITIRQTIARGIWKRGMETYKRSENAQ